MSSMVGTVVGSRTTTTGNKDVWGSKYSEPIREFYRFDGLNEWSGGLRDQFPTLGGLSDQFRTAP